MGPDGLSATTTGGSGDAAEVVEEFASGRLTRRQAIGRLAILGIGLTSASTLLAACSTNSEPKSPRSEPKSEKTEPNATNSGPNILIVIADDMRLDWLRFMPKVRKLIQAPGRTFTQARCNVGLCQPSRVGLHTGQMSKNNNELGVGFHGTEFKDLNNFVGEWMRASGYHCGMFGKFINFWDGFGGVNAPAGWDTWVEFAGGGAANPYDFKVHLNSGTQRIKGTYDADYLASRASEFVRNSDLPFFCILAPSQPHEPFTPRADLAHLYGDLTWRFVDEVDVSDKPSWIQALPPLTRSDRDGINKAVRGALRELAAVDDMVGTVLAAIPPARLAETIIVFTSDNGVHYGEHRRFGGDKSGPYDVTLHVPLVIRGPGFAPGPDVTAPVMVFQDLTATALKLAKATPGLPNQAGVSLVDVCANPASYAPRAILHEIGEGFFGSGDGVTTGPDHPVGFRKLFRYPSVRSGLSGPYLYEAYDLDTDPNELVNWADDAARRPERDALEAQLNSLLA